MARKRVPHLWASVLLIAVGLAPHFALAGDTETKDELIKLRKEVAAAEMNGDAAKLDALFADEYTHLHADGRMDSKAEYLNRFKSGSRKYQLYELSDIDVRL